MKNLKILNGILGIAFAGLVLFQTGEIASKEAELHAMSILEAELITEIEEIFAEEEEFMLEELIIEEIESQEFESTIKIYDNNNKLIAEGNVEDNPELRKLVNQADLLSDHQGTKYFRIAE